MSLVFYDTETTGIETYFDQILQFAAIKTDADLNEIDRFEIRCRLLPNVVPAPGAMRVTGVKASQLTDPSCHSHYEMVRAIREKLLSWSPALFIGWNTLDFDEDLMRQALYKTLHNPYLTNTEGNSRTDAMKIVQACSLVAPDVLNFPINEKGKKTFKLDRLAPANGFNHDRAHDALGDVEATIFICRLIMEKAPDIWSSFMKFSTKSSVVDYITEEKLFGLTEFYFGNPHSWMVTTLGQNQKNKAEWYAYDLSVAPESLLGLSDAQLTKRLGKSPKPMRRLKSNAAPILFAADDALGICSGLNCGLEELERRADMVQTHAELSKRLVGIFESTKEDYPISPHVEKQIYDGFTTKSDERLLDQFHEVDWPQRYAIVEKLQDLRLKVLGIRLIYLERPDLLNEMVRQEHELAAAKRLMGLDAEVTWLTLPQALKELDEMLAAASDVELEMLKEHRQYLQHKHEEALKLIS
jgi:exodeoxyribonuclease I